MKREDLPYKVMQQHGLVFEDDRIRGVDFLSKTSKQVHNHPRSAICACKFILFRMDSVPSWEPMSNHRGSRLSRSVINLESFVYTFFYFKSVFIIDICIFISFFFVTDSTFFSSSLFGDVMSIERKSNWFIY